MGVQYQSSTLETKPICLWSMAAMLHGFVAVAFLCTHPRAIPLAMITVRKSTPAFPFLSSMSIGLRLATIRAAGALLWLLYTLQSKTRLPLSKAKTTGKILTTIVIL